MQKLQLGLNWFNSYKTMSNKNITKNLVNTHSESIDWSVIQKDMRTKLGNDIYESWLRKIDFVEERFN